MEYGLQSSIMVPPVEDAPIVTASTGAKPQPLMNLTIVRGALPAGKKEAILEQYNRLSNSRIPISEFSHWVEKGPEGPAWHALLENECAEIVGHMALIPFRSRYKGERIVTAKAEYAFIREEYQTAKIRGFEKSGKPRNAIMVQRLFLRWQDAGLGPLMISTSAVRQRSLSGVGCSLAKFPVSECLLVLRPWTAARMTPNLGKWQRTLLGLAGVLQQVAWSGIRLIPNGVMTRRQGGRPESSLNQANNEISFFEDSESAEWRYLRGQYERIVVEPESDQFVIVKKGARDRYLRVCQWRLAAHEPTLRLVAQLVEMARKDNALGVRWAVYGNDQSAASIPLRLKKVGFVCAARTRALLIYSKEKEFLSSERWNLNDAMFSFDP